MREFTFTPGYYEWHLKDKSTGKLLHVMADPAEDTVHEDGTDMTLDELVNMCYNDLDAADNQYIQNEDYNGILLNNDDSLSMEEMTAASELMGKTLHDYYIGDGSEPEGEPLKF